MMEDASIHPGGLDTFHIASLWSWEIFFGAVVIQLNRMGFRTERGALQV